MLRGFLSQCPSHSPGHWDDEINYLENTYVPNSRYEIKAVLRAVPKQACGAYTYTPGKKIRIITGILKKYNFLYSNDVLVSELIDPHAIAGIHIGFSPYCTKLAIRDVEMRRVVYHDFLQTYDPEN